MMQNKLLQKFSQLNLTISSDKGLMVKKTKSIIDLTLLNDSTEEQDLIALREKAIKNEVAAICVFPSDLIVFNELAYIGKATVINFPSGLNSTDLILRDVKTIVEQGIANEIDYVFPYSLYLSGNEQKALLQSKQIFQQCKAANLKFKVIIESGAFPNLEKIYQLSLSLIEQGVDFIKTSTGKYTHGASFEAAFAILEAIKESKASCGLKISGGIKETAQAFSYITLAEERLKRPVDKSWFRIGASSLLDELVLID